MRHTLRVLLRSPGFTITAVLILGFGIGANTAIFSVIDGALLNPLPVPRADRLVQIFQPRVQNDTKTHLDYPDYLDICRTQHSFDELAVYDWTEVDFNNQKNPEHVRVVFASANLFELSARPVILGRTFTNDEDKFGGPHVVVLSQAFWRTHFNSDPSIVGKNLTLGDESFQVIGVCPEQAGNLAELVNEILYLPLHAEEVFGPSDLQKRDSHYLECIGRLKVAVKLPQAQADLEVIQNNLARSYPSTDEGYRIHLIPLVAVIEESYSSAVWFLGGAAGGLLLLSCANVANLLFGRGLERRREIAIRATLGASRVGLILELLTETASLALLAGGVGLLIAICGIGLVKVLVPEYMSAFQEINLNTTALVFIFCLTVLVACLSGILPAWNLSKTNVGIALKDEGGRLGTLGPQKQRAQALLVVGQVAVACVLLIGGGLLVRSFQAVRNLPLGFNPHHLLTANIMPTGKRYSDSRQLRIFFDAILEKVRRLPGVIDAGMSDNQPFEVLYGGWKFPFSIPGRPDPEPGKGPAMDVEAISSGYFQTLQIPLLQGRDFDSRDRIGGQNVIIVNNALAQTFFPGQSPIGKQIHDHHEWLGNKDWTIVGVVDDIRHGTPDFAEAPFLAYTPYNQRELFREFLVVRTAGDPTSLIPAVRKIVAEIDPDVPVDRATSFDDFLAGRLWARRLSASLATLFSGAAILLSAVGLYGVLAYSVVQRTREIGVRIAIGAQRASIMKLVLWRGLKLVVIGTVIGIGSALVLVRFIDSILYGVSGYDPVTLALTILILGVTATSACLLPALGAIRIKPITALRE
ncbi:MAG: ABC transporter permease [Verrucomicrobia bacterium]|nr:ABC transporter permease [Verrucomicrobiota bacterium]